MKRKDTATSTEKLLEVIRSGGSGQPAAAPGSGPAPTAVSPDPAPSDSIKRKTTRTALSSPISLGKAQKDLVVGVEVGRFGLRMVKNQRKGDEYLLKEFKHVPYPAGMTPESPSYGAFLRQELSAFCGSPRGVELWSTIAGQGVEMLHVTIPKVPDAKLASTVHWSVKREKEFNEAQMVLDFEIQDETVESGQHKYQVQAYLVPRQRMEQMKSLFSKAGYKLHGLTVTATATQNLFRTSWLPEQKESCATLFMGRDWSRIDIFHKGNLIFSRAIRSGTSGMIETLMEEYSEQARKSRTNEPDSDLPLISLEDEVPFVSGPLLLERDTPQVDAEEDDQEEGSLGITLEEANAAGMDLDTEIDLSSPPVEQKPDSGDTAQNESQMAPIPNAGTTEPTVILDISPEQAQQLLRESLLNAPKGPFNWYTQLSAEEAFDMVRPALARLVRQIERTFEHYGRTMKKPAVDVLYLAGEFAANQQLRSYLNQQLAMPLELMDPLDPRNKSLGIAVPPRDPSQRMSYSLVTSLALSSNKTTPNLLNTFQQRLQEQKQTRASNIVLGACAALFLVLGGVYWFLHMQASDLEHQVKELKQEVASFTPRLTQTLMLQTASKVNAKNVELRKISHRYDTLGALSEISSETPPHIKLTALRLEMGQPDDPREKEKANKNAAQGKKTAPGPAKPRLMVVEGMVTGDARDLEADLASYMLRLGRSPLFENPSVHSANPEIHPTEGDSLKFVLHVDVP